jgi:hypothetical protein
MAHWVGGGVGNMPGSDDRGSLMVDLTTKELDRLYEGSKDDHFIVVGSEVRQMIGMIRRATARIDELEAGALEIMASIREEEWRKAPPRIYLMAKGMFYGRKQEG